METTESLGYLKGLLEGLDIDADKKEAKVYNAIVDVLTNLIEDVDDITEGMELMAEQIDAVDEDLSDLEEFEVECPLCGTAFEVDEETVLDGGAIPCPNCGEMLEFEIEECDCDED